MTLDAPATRPLGPLGDVGRLSFGCWRFVGHTVERATALVETALDLGMNLVDTADVYGLDWGGTAFGQAEALLGEVLGRSPGLRDRMVLATKGGIVPGVPYDSSSDHLRKALEASLSRLGVDHVDLYQIHRPDLFTHSAEVAGTLAAFVDEGKVRAVGVSNHTVSQVEALASHLGGSLVSHQPQFSVTHLGPMLDGTLDQCMRLDLVPLAWSPLGGGAVMRGEGVRTDLTVALDRLAAAHGVDRAAVALAFVLAHPSRPVAILGTQNPERLRRATDAITVELDRSDVYGLVEAATGEPLP